MSLLQTNPSLDRVLWVPPPVSYGSISINQYHKELQGALLSIGDVGYEVTSLENSIEGLPKRGSKIARFSDRYLRYPYRCLRSPQTSIFHGLAEDAGELLKWAPTGAKKVATVHDVIPLFYPQGLTEKQRDRYRKQIEKLAAFDAIISVSDYSAKSLQEIVDIPSEKIHVIPNGVNTARFSKSRPIPSHLQFQNYVLSVSNDAPRKNLEILPELFANLSKSHPDVSLVRVGAPLPSAIRESWDEIVGASRLVEIGGCSDEELTVLYQNAEAFVFPSFAEGFGLPVLESMASGCPVAASDRTSLPEVGGAYVDYFDPADALAASKALSAAIGRRQDEHYRLEMLKHAESFTWENHVRGILKVYQEIL